MLIVIGPSMFENYQFSAVVILCLLKKIAAVYLSLGSKWNRSLKPMILLGQPLMKTLDSLNIPLTLMWFLSCLLSLLTFTFDLRIWLHIITTTVITDDPHSLTKLLCLLLTLLELLGFIFLPSTLSMMHSFHRRLCHYSLSTILAFFMASMIAFAV